MTNIKSKFANSSAHISTMYIPLNQISRTQTETSTLVWPSQTTTQNCIASQNLIGPFSVLIFHHFHLKKFFNFHEKHNSLDYLSFTFLSDKSCKVPKNTPKVFLMIYWNLECTNLIWLSCVGVKNHLTKKNFSFFLMIQIPIFLILNA